MPKPQLGVHIKLAGLLRPCIAVHYLVRTLPFHDFGKYPDACLKFALTVCCSKSIYAICRRPMQRMTHLTAILSLQPACLDRQLAARRSTLSGSQCRSSTLNRSILRSSTITCSTCYAAGSWKFGGALTWRHMRRAGHVNSPPRIEMQYPKHVRIPDPGSDLVRSMEKKTIPSAVSKHKAVM